MAYHIEYAEGSVTLRLVVVTILFSYSHSPGLFNVYGNVVSKPGCIGKITYYKTTSKPT